MGWASYWPLLNVHSAPPPAFFMISFGSIVHSNFKMLSTIEPAASSANGRIRRDRNLHVGRKAEIRPAAEKSRDYSPIESTDQWGMLGYYSG